MTDRQNDLRAAATAAAQWARTRRATWTDAPVPVFQSAAMVMAMGADAAVLPETAIETGQAGPSAVSALIDGVWAILQAIPVAAIGRVSLRLLRPAVAVAAVLALAVTARTYWPHAMQAEAMAKFRAAKTETAAKLRAAAVITPPSAPDVPLDKSVGQLRVTADPVEAKVYVDGRLRGVTPLLVERLKPGMHAVVLDSEQGRVEESVRIAGGERQEISESIYEGWVALYSPFDVIVTDSGRGISPDEKRQLLLRPGPHELRIENRALNYVESRHVEVRPGEVTTLSIAPPQSTLTVTSNSPGEVWLDGKKIGDAPLEAAPVDLGTHALVVKHASGEKRELSITVTTKPLTIAM